MNAPVMKTLWILRHGEAANTTPDPARALTRAGREEVLRSAAHLIAEPLQLILASPYTRAQQTAQLVQGALGQGIPLETVDWLTPDTDPELALAALDERGMDQVLLVSHQPLVGMLLGLLERGERSGPHGMGTASLARLEGAAPLAGLMTLRSLRHSH